MIKKLAFENTPQAHLLSRERERLDASEANAAVLVHQLATHQRLTGSEWRTR